jgi:hypothetical protein
MPTRVPARPSWQYRISRLLNKPLHGDDGDAAAVLLANQHAAAAGSSVVIDTLCQCWVWLQQWCHCPPAHLVQQPCRKLVANGTLHVPVVELVHTMCQLLVSGTTTAPPGAWVLFGASAHVVFLCRMPDI